MKHIGNSEIAPTQVCLNVFDKAPKAINGERTIFSINGAGTPTHPHAIKKNLDLNLMSYIKMNSKWFIDLNTKPRKLLEENI